MLLQALTRGALVLGVLVFARPAQAWIFPEHMELTRFAYERDLPPAARNQLQVAIAAAMAHGLPLCRSIDPLERYKDAQRTCIPYTALPAFAGDHANDIEELAKFIKKRAALEILVETSELWSSFLHDHAPFETQRLYRSKPARWDSWQSNEGAGDAQRIFTRELDLALESIDKDYSSRAGEARAHFQDSLMPLADLLAQLKSRGNVDNALAQVFAHHIRSLQHAAAGARLEPGKERNGLWADALLEHANALHFLQDAYASGHMGTEHRVAVDIEKARRHDFLNRVGLNVQRAALGARCENVTPSGKSSATANDPRKAGCWVAFGDAYLDGFNARIIADAVARLQLQFAMALAMDREASSTLAMAWLDGCPDDQGVTGPIELKGGRQEEMLPTAEEGVPDGNRPYARFEGEGVAHVHRCRFVASADGGVECRYTTDASPKAPAPGECQGPLRVTVFSEAFDPQVAIHRCGDETCSRPRKVKAESDISDFDIQARTTFSVEPGVTYEIVIGNDGRTPREGGDPYRWEVVAVPPPSKQPPPAITCEPLLRASELLDPAPTWSLTDEERKRREKWTKEERLTMARYVVQGAHDALRVLADDDQRACADGCKTRPLISAGSNSAANVSLTYHDAIGDPLAPCAESELWQVRSHPLCSTSGGAFQFGQPHASLWRALIAVWPTPMGDITAIEGKDALGHGMAAHLVFGGGPIAQTWDDVGWSIAGWLASGLSYRVNNLFPDRENRSVVELSFAVQPTLSMNDRSRFLMMGFVEARFPLIPFILASCYGASSSVEYGPLGYRYYFQWPSTIPGGEGRWFAGVDVELLNIDLDGRGVARNREAGHLLDLELRMRFGLFEEWYLLGGDEDRLMPVLSAELAWGHSTYFADL